MSDRHNPTGASLAKHAGHSLCTPPTGVLSTFHLTVLRTREDVTSSKFSAFHAHQ